MGRKPNLTSIVDRTIASMSREVLIRALAEMPGDTTVGELLDAFTGSFRQDLRSLSLSELTGALDGVAPSAARQAESSGAESRSEGKGFNTRTDSGRDAIDASISNYLQANRAARAEEIRCKVGGSSAQIRQSMVRLMSRNLVTRSGRKRSTTYTWA